jgi:hypothetical protein
MDSFLQDQPIAKETNVGNNKKTKNAKPSKFEVIFKEMKVSVVEFSKKIKYKYDHIKDNTFSSKTLKCAKDES